MRKRLRYVDPAICAKVFAVMYGLFGIVAALFFLLATLFNQHVYGIGFAILMPFLYALGGLIGGYFGALIYNVVAELTGGLEFVFDDVEPVSAEHGTVVYSKPPDQS